MYLQVCSFIQWRSIVAVFTMVLPSAKRETLPPQYNVARSDVFFMLFVTIACLLLDVATLAIFVIAGFVYLFQAARAQYCGHSKTSSSNKKKFFEWRGKENTMQRSNSTSNIDASNDEENGYDKGIEVTPSGTIVDGITNPVQAANSFLDVAEQIIFPVDTMSDD